MGGTKDGLGLNAGRTGGALPQRRQRHRREALLCAAAAGAVALSLATPPRAEASPLPELVEMLDIVPGTTTVLNPTTGNQELVTQILSPAGVNPPDIVLTAENNIIVLYASAVGDTVELTRYNTTTKKNVTYDYTVTKVYTNSTTGDVDHVQLELNGSSPAVYQTLNLVTSTTPTTVNNGGAGSGVVDKSPAPSAGTKQVIKQGAKGSDGNPGVGVSFGLFTIEYAPGNGGPGANGPDLDYTDAHALTGDYNSTVANTPAIQIISLGGYGGSGGDSVGNIPAGEGGAAGAGGNVPVDRDRQRRDPPGQLRRHLRGKPRRSGRRRRHGHPVQQRRHRRRLDPRRRRLCRPDQHRLCPHLRQQLAGHSRREPRRLGRQRRLQHRLRRSGRRRELWRRRRQCARRR